MNGFIGRQGERYFSELCDKAGLIPNKSLEIDATSWDYIVEFPIEDKYAAYDKSSLPMECKIQVKSTKGSDQFEDVTLSNLQRMVLAPLPYFFCFVQFDNTDSVSSVYLVHVGEDIMENVLRRLSSAEGRLNKKTMRISYRDAVPLDLSDRYSIKNELIKYCPDGIKAYVDNKQKLINSLGYEEFSQEMVLITELEEPNSKFNKFILGIDVLEAQNIDFFETRFKKKRPITNPFGLPSRDFNQPIVLSNVKSGGDVKIEFRKSKVKKGIVFNGRLTSSLEEMIPSLKPNDPIVRLNSSFFEILVYKKQMANFKWDMGDNIIASIEDISKFLDLLNILNFSSKIFLKITGKDVPDLGFIQIGTEKITDFYNDLVGLSYKLQTILEAACLSLSKIKFNLDDLTRQSKIIQRIDRLINAEVEGHTVSMGYSLSVPASIKFDRVACVYIESVQSRGATICYVFAFKSNVVKVKGLEIKVEEATVQLMGALVITLEDESIVGATKIFEEYKESLGQEDYMLICPQDFSSDALALAELNVDTVQVD